MSPMVYRILCLMRLMKVTETMSDELITNRQERYLKFYDAETLAQDLGINVKTARGLFNVPDFPTQEIGLKKIAEVGAVREWFKTPHRKDSKR